jgi:predicted RNA-binding Zn ribbon-like protein
MSDEAPGDLELVRSFINTVDLEGGPEQLTDPAALSGWLRAHDLLEGGDAGADDLRQAVAVREALRVLCWANNGLQASRGASATLDEAAARAGLRLRFRDPGEAALMPSAEGVDAALGRLLAIVAESMRDGSWARLKACRSEVCGWAFYDRSRNRSGTWCDMAVCGNRTKVRAYRERGGARASGGTRAPEG